MDKQTENESKDKRARHSGYGVASLFLAIISIAFTVFTTSRTLNMDMPGFIFGFGAMGYFIASLGNLIGIILGVVGKRRNDKIFSTLGIIFNGILGLFLIWVALVFFILMIGLGN